MAGTSGCYSAEKLVCCKVVFRIFHLPTPVWVTHQLASDRERDNKLCVGKGRAGQGVATTEAFLFVL